jgi:hypothetical protein
MKQATFKSWTLGLALAAIATVAVPGTAQAYFRPRAFVGFGFYPGYYGYPYGYAPRIDRNYARLMGWGALDLHVKPGKAEVWVDGHFAGKAGDFDGWPSVLWLEKGEHDITVYLGGYQTFKEKYSVEPGTIFDVHLKMEKGESTPPKAAK